MRDRPELRGKILTHGSWDYDFVPAIEPQADELVVPKARYSGFCGTDLDGLLRARNIRHLIFTGIASNVCVDSTIREAYHREYFCVLVDDATQQSGQRFLHDAVLYNVETFFGWVTTDRQHLRRAQVRDLRCGLVRLEPVLLLMKYLFRHPEVRGAQRRASKGDGPGAAASFEARPTGEHLRMTDRCDLRSVKHAPA